MNCWEFMNCERQPNGGKVSEFGICPAATETTLNGINGGRNAGRCCWKIAGTLCNVEVRGLFASELLSCLDCEFLKKVQKEEGDNFKFLIE